jgi:hypothetical protein
LSTHAFRPRSELHRRVVAALASLPEVNAIHAFGREVEGGLDEYSDIDLIVYSDDLAATQAKCPDVLGAISPVIGTYCIVLDPRVLAQMVMFRDYSPYQKLDISFTDDPDTRQAFAPLACLYQREPLHRPSQTRIELNGQRDTLANCLNDVLFSIPRWTKCLFRRDPDLYRRWTGTVEHLAVMLYERYFGWERGHRYRLKPQEYKALYKNLSPEHRTLLERIQPLDGRPDLVLGYELAVGAIIELYQAKANALGETIDMSFASYMQRFLREEIERYRCSGPSTDIKAH